MPNSRPMGMRSTGRPQSGSQSQARMPNVSASGYAKGSLMMPDSAFSEPRGLLRWTIRPRQNIPELRAGNCSHIRAGTAAAAVGPGRLRPQRCSGRLRRCVRTAMTVIQL